eukprot:GDKK01020095.1.p1 GENE.GDKK01020095.1~~GDKK01020095.1.p1  ORF type:complete len:312 (-),score=37.69 GDKK01020095.1:273-1136(-)
MSFNGRSFELPLEIPQVDEILGGGLRTGIITEIYGCAGSGKTQVCYHAIARNLLDILKNKEPHGRSCVVIFHTEGLMAASRLKTILKFQIEKDVVNQKLPNCPFGFCLEYVNCSHWEDQCRYLMEFVFVFQTSHHGLFLEAVREKLFSLSLSFRIRMVVIDSIAGVFRSLSGDNNSRENFSERSAWLFGMTGVLRRLASEHASIVLVTNQVTSKVDGYHKGEEASLGLCWSSCVQMRIRMDKKLGGKRAICVERCSWCQGGESVIIIAREGCVESQEYHHQQMSDES